MTGAQTSMDRVLTTLGHQEPDRVPLFMTTTMHGARELGLGIREYFSRPENVVEGQVRMQRRYRSDFLYPVMYAALDAEAFGAEVLFREDGPANAGAPVIRSPQDIDSLEPPDPRVLPMLQRALAAVAGAAERSAGRVPVVGLVVSPFSLPIMQMGFEGYLQLQAEEPERFWRLMAVNEEFCVRWANAQLAAGATALGFFDPCSSPTVMVPDDFRRTGLLVARRTIARINGPTVFHLASGRSLPILDDIATTGTAMVGVSADEDLAEIKRRVQGRLTVAGNLNGLTMRRWTAEDAEREVKRAIGSAGPGGGFVLADNHGEIPWQVPEEVLDAIAAAVDRWGRYPLTWIEQERDS